MSIYYGGKIITMNNKQPIAEAVGITGEKINAVGSLEDVKQSMSVNPVMIDLNFYNLINYLIL